jgi:hypothetical protein
MFVRWPLAYVQMTLQSRAIVATLAAAVLLIVASTFFAFGSPLRGWLGLAGFTLAALRFGAGMAGMPRHSSMAFGAYMLAAGSLFALPSVWTHRPPWWDTGVQWAFIGAATWMPMAFWLNRPRSAPGG